LDRVLENPLDPLGPFHSFSFFPFAKPNGWGDFLGQNPSLSLRAIPCSLSLMLVFQGDALVVGFHFHCQFMILNHKLDGFIQAIHKKINSV